MTETAAAAPDGDRHLLVVDDDSRLRRLLTRYLGEEGFRVSGAGDIAEARQALAGLAFDLIVLDVMLPDASGIDFTRELRQRSDVPILLLTARGEASDRIDGLEAGADDYLAKPFEPRELVLRIGTILRRTRQDPPPPDVLRFGRFTFTPATGELLRDDTPVYLTSGEIALLRVLARQPGQPIDRAQLGDRAGIAGSDRAVDTQMARLRRKIEPDPRQPRHLLTMRGEGYVLRAGG